jgi:large conductance mechanosensitive channel
MEPGWRVQPCLVNALSGKSPCPCTLRSGLAFPAGRLPGAQPFLRLRISIHRQPDEVIRMNWKLLSEFRDFALKGNVVDLAVGVIIGAAFGKIVSALVENVLMPPIGFLLSGVDFKDLAVNLGTAQSPVLIKYGAFLQTLIDFIIIAWVLFLVIKAMITLKKRFEKEAVAAPPAPTPSEIYLREIRDALVKK